MASHTVLVINIGVKVSLAIALYINSGGSRTTYCKMYESKAYHYAKYPMIDQWVRYHAGYHATDRGFLIALMVWLVQTYVGVSSILSRGSSSHRWYRKLRSTIQGYQSSVPQRRMYIVIHVIAFSMHRGMINNICTTFISYSVHIRYDWGTSVILPVHNSVDLFSRANLHGSLSKLLH